MGMQRGRPMMPGYGIDEGEAGLLEWGEALERLTGSRNYWLATTRPDGRPHVMPVWAVWLDDALWFSSSLGSRKIRNLRAQPKCTMTTEDAAHPVVVDGVAEVVTGMDRIRIFLDAINVKYAANLDIEFLDPDVNATVLLSPEWIFALNEDNFTKSPTKWEVLPGG